MVVASIQKLKKVIYLIIYKLVCLTTSIDKDKILIASNRSNELEGNIEFIYNELKKYNKKKVILLLTNKQSFFYNLKFIIFMATSKIIIIDDFFPLVYPLKVRKNAKLVQVWHAVGAFKTVGFSRLNKPGGPNKNSITHRNYTDIIISSSEIEKNYIEAFHATKDKIHSLGTPRTDMFFDKKMKEDIISDIYRNYTFLENKKVILFAPTFRGNGKKTAYYDMSYLDLDIIYRNLKKEEVFIIKMHPFIKNRPNIKEKYKEKIFDFSDYNNINNLLLITNLLITDYSSVIFEYALLKRPIIFYVPDLEEYKSSRDFYYPFDEYTYGDCCYKIDELVQKMNNPILHKKKLKKFTNNFLNKCDGLSTKRFINEIVLKG